MKILINYTTKSRIIFIERHHEGMNENKQKPGRRYLQHTKLTRIINNLYEAILKSEIDHCYIPDNYLVII